MSPIHTIETPKTEAMNRTGFIGGLIPREDGAHGTPQQAFAGGT